MNHEHQKWKSTSKDGKPEIAPLPDAFLAILEQATNARLAWLEKHLALLLAEGFAIQDLHICEHPNHRTVITARGIERFEHRTEFKGHGMEDFQRMPWPR